MELNKLRFNLWKYALLLIANKRIFVAILGAYYLTVPGVDAGIIGSILLAGSLAGFALEIPSGYISDKFGHKQSIVLSRVLVLLSTLLFLMADNIGLLMLGSIFLSAGSAFLSGTGSAFMHETLKGLGRDKEYSAIMGKISSLGFAVPIIFMVLTPFLVSFSFKAPFVVSLATDMVGLFAAMFLVVPKVSLERINEIRATNFRQVMEEGYNFGFFKLALFSGIVTGFLFGISGFRSPYQLLIGIPVIWFGVFFGFGRAFASLMLAYGGKIKNKINLNSFYGFQLILYAVLIFVLGLTEARWVIVGVFILMNAFQWGLSRIDESYFLDAIGGSNFKATLLSVASQIENIFSAFAAFGIGWLIQVTSYRIGFLYSGLCFVLMLLPLYAYIVKKNKVI